MTEPDEALRWAIEQNAPLYLRHSLALAYRAGQAASAARIKALEYDLMWTDQAWEAAQEAVVYGYTLMDKQDARIKALEEALLNLVDRVTEDDGEGCQTGVNAAEMISARALLKEADRD